ncbi:hypothetical protein NGRA_2626 [Nosema granulosis]|uniref:Uncharacterized protein n=1 Tax=Nosema granulosis TaxID=83296 RepID=A0A9P6GWQ3_9MICR|nr:hypothetical protein NGRA_2626 [Nosema granulosis]
MESNPPLHKSITLHKPVAVCMNDLPQNNEITDIEELNRVFKFLGIEVVLDSKDSNTAMLNKLEEICSKFDYFSDLINSIQQTRDNEMDVEKYKLVERECDMLEISLASLKDQYSEYRDLDKYSLEDLENELAVLNQNFNDVQFETINREVLSKIYDFIKGEPVDGDLINSLSYVTEMKGFRNLIEKYEILSDIDQDSVFYMLAKNESIKMDDVCKVLGGDRINTLELLYYLQSVDVIVFDNLKGSIKLKK